MVFGHDEIVDGETEPGTVVGAPVAEEGLEGALADCFRHLRPVILDLDMDRVGPPLEAAKKRAGYQPS